MVRVYDRSRTTPGTWLIFQARENKLGVLIWSFAESVKEKPTGLPSLEIRGSGQPISPHQATILTGIAEGVSMDALHDLV